MAGVSILLAARNEADRIGAAIESIRLQSIEDWEIIVVDDGSTDETADVVRSIVDERIRLIVCPPLGLAAALNRGLSSARAPFVARQDADDLSLPGRLAHQIEFLAAKPEVAVVGTDWIEIGRDGEAVRPRVRFVAGRVNTVLPRFNPLAHTSVIFRRDVVLRAGGYDERLRFAQDYDLWLRLAATGETLWNLELPLVQRSMTGLNVAARRERAQIRSELSIRLRDMRRRRRHGLPVRHHVLAIARRLVGLAVPLGLKRELRRLQGKAP